MSTQVTTIIIAAIIAICYLATIVLNHLWGKEKQDLYIALKSIKNSLLEIDRSLLEVNKRIDYMQCSLEEKEEE